MVLASNDRRTVVTLLPSMVVVQTAAYARYSTSLGDPLRVALRTFAEATGASVVQRLGLRYINRLQDAAASSPAFWRDHVRPAFAGPLVGETGGWLRHFTNRSSSSWTSPLPPVSRVGCSVSRAWTSATRSWSTLTCFREQALDFDETLVADMTRQLNRNRAGVVHTGAVGEVLG